MHPVKSETFFFHKTYLRSIGGIHVTHCFDFCTQQPNFLEAINGSRQWENFQNLLLKQITNFLEKTVTSSVTLFSYLKKLTFLTVTIFHLFLL